MYSSNCNCRSKEDDLESVVLNQVLKSAKAFEAASIDQRAYLRYKADSANVDMKKYVDQIKSEMEKDNNAG